MPSALISTSLSKTESIASGESPADGSSSSSSFGLRDERARERDELALTSRERARALARPLARGSGTARARARRRLGARSSAATSALTCTFSATRQRREDVVGLRDEVEPAPGQPVGAHPGHVLAVEAHRAACGARDEPVDRLQHRRLAGAVRPDDGDDLVARRRCSETPRRTSASSYPASSASTSSRLMRPRAAPRDTRRRRARRARTSSGVPCAITRPSFITITRSLAAHHEVEVVLDDEERDRRRDRAARGCARAARRASVGLTPAIGSSSSRIRGSAISARIEVEQLPLAAGERAGERIGVPVEAARASSSSSRGVAPRARGARPADARRRAARPGAAAPRARRSRARSCASARAASGTCARAPRERSGAARSRSMRRPSRSTRPDCGAEEARDAVEQRRLARAVRPDQAGDRACLDVEASRRRPRARRRTRARRSRTSSSALTRAPSRRACRGCPAGGRARAR